jgi:CoA-dependent NAD(P)H sulfur oxidoreductase
LWFRRFWLSLLIDLDDQPKNTLILNPSIDIFNWQVTMACLFILTRVLLLGQYRKKIIIVGGNDAGLSAAGKAKRLDPNLHITVLEKGEYLGYSTCSFPNFISGEAHFSDVCGPTADQIASSRGFEVKPQTEVVKIEPTKRQLLAVENGKELRYKYDRLVLATGALPIVPEILKVDVENVFVLRNLQHAKIINTFISSNMPKVALVVGSGFLGLEMAEALKARNIYVKLIDNNSQFLGKYFKEISEPVLSNLRENNIDFFLDEEIKNVITENGIVRAVELQRRGRLDVDLIIVAAGIAPSVQLAKDAGIPLGTTGAIAVNNRQETKRLNIYAVGDCAESRNVVCKKNMWLPFAGIASKQGRIAGTNIAGKMATMPSVAGTAIIKAFGIEFGHTGLDYQQVFKAGFDPAFTIIKQHSKPAFIKGACEITVALIGDKKSKRILGAQIAGERDVGHRLNIIATALTGSLTVQDIEFLDFGYTPPITNMWDPIAIAANSLQKKMKRS